MSSRFYRAAIAGAWLASLSLGAHAAAPKACDASQDFTTPQWQTQCGKAISKERDPGKRAALLHVRAYVAVEQYRYDDALADLEAAISADPKCADCLHERAYVNSELGNYTAAIADLDHELALRPEFASAWRERAFARSFNGDLEGAYQDRVHALELEPQSIGAIVARADAALWLGRFDEAAADFTRAESLAKESGDEKAGAHAAESREAIALWRGSSGDKDAASRCVMQGITSSDPDLKTLIGDCTQAFLTAQDKPAKAEALSTRSTLWAVLDQSWDRAAADRRVAAGLDPANPERFINLGYAYIGVAHSRAAIQEFTRALSMKQHWLALAGRASARNNVGDTAGAEADALASMKLELNAPAASVLGDLAYDRGDKEKARAMYLGAYQMGSRDDGLMGRLKELGVADPDKASLEAAQ